METNFCVKNYELAEYQTINRDELIRWTYLAYNTAEFDEDFESKYCDFFYEENNKVIKCSHEEYLSKIETNFTRAQLIDIEKVDDSTLLYIYLSLDKDATGFIDK